GAESLPMPESTPPSPGATSKVCPPQPASTKSGEKRRMRARVMPCVASRCGPTTNGQKNGHFGVRGATARSAVAQIGSTALEEVAQHVEPRPAARGDPTLP